MPSWTVPLSSCEGTIAGSSSLSHRGFFNIYVMQEHKYLSAAVGHPTAPPLCRPRSRMSDFTTMASAAQALCQWHPQSATPCIVYQVTLGGLPLACNFQLQLAGLDALASKRTSYLLCCRTWWVQCACTTNQLKGVKAIQTWDPCVLLCFAMLTHETAMYCGGQLDTEFIVWNTAHDAVHAVQPRLQQPGCRRQQQQQGQHWHSATPHQPSLADIQLQSG